jgi:hypothetical protein
MANLPLFIISLLDIKWQSSHNQQHMLPLYQGPIILSQQTASLQQVTSCPWSFSGSQLLEPAWCEWQPRREGRALAGAPAVLLKNRGDSANILTVCFQAINKPEITTIHFVNTNINSMELVPPFSHIWIGMLTPDICICVMSIMSLHNPVICFCYGMILCELSFAGGVNKMRTWMTGGGGELKHGTTKGNKGEGESFTTKCTEQILISIKFSF